MNAYELIHLASEASGGGVSYSVSFRHSENLRGATDVTVTRWDSVASRYVIYNDNNYVIMKDTAMRDDYRPLRECVKIMREDVERLSNGYTPSHIRATENGVAARRKIIDYVREYKARHGVSPTQQEIADGIGRTKGSSLLQLLRDMRATGLIHYNDRGCRSIAINEKGVREWEESLQR